MATILTTITNPHDAAKPFHMVNLANVIKLTPTNYLTWKLQLYAILQGYDLLGYIDGSVAPPPQTTLVNNVATTNPDYTAWLRQDRLLFGAVIGTLSPSVAPLVARAATVKDAWDTLQTNYARPSKGHINQLKDRLRTTVKGALSVPDYLQNMVTTADLLAELGKPVDSDDLVSHILTGLGDGYTSLVDALKARDSTINV